MLYALELLFGEGTLFYHLAELWSVIPHFIANSLLLALFFTYYFVIYVLRNIVQWLKDDLAKEDRLDRFLDLEPQGSYEVPLTTVEEEPEDEEADPPGGFYRESYRRRRAVHPHKHVQRTNEELFAGMSPIEQIEWQEAQDLLREEQMAGEKEVRTRKWTKRTNPRDSERFVRYQAEKLKKLNDLKRKKGREEVIPEGCESISDKAFKEKVLHQMKTMSTITPKDDYEVYVNLAMQGVAMLSVISTCSSSQEISKAIQGFLAGKLDVRIIKFLEKRLLSQNTNDMLPEGESDFTSLVARLRASTLDLMDAPFGRFLRDTLTVIIVQGLSPKNIFEEESVLFRFLDKMEKETLSISTRSYFETMFSLMEYSAGLVDAVRRGEDPLEYVCPTSLSLRVAQLLSKGAQLKSGLLEDICEETMNEFENEASSVQAQLKSLLLGVKGKMAVTYDLQYQKISLLVEEIRAFRKNEGFRKSPFVFCLSGESQVGKTELLDLLIRLCELGACEEFTPEKIATIPVDAEYDDTIKIGTRVFKIDDAEALKPDRSARDSIVKKILKMINNIAMPTNQSAVERKSNIYFRPKVVAMNTNVDHLNAMAFFHEPMAVYNRIFFIEVLLAKEYSDQFGKLDKKKANEDGAEFSVPMHLFHPYYWSRTGSRGECTKVYIGEHPMDARTFMKYFSDRCVQHFMEQEALEKKKLREREVPFCPTCCCPMAPGWCECKPTTDIKPEGMVAEFMGTLLDDYALDMLSFTITRVWETLGGRFALWFQNYALYMALQAVKVFVGANLMVDHKVRRLSFVTLALFSVYLPWKNEWSWKLLFSGVALFMFFLYNATLGYARAVRYNVVQLTLSSIHEQVAPTFLVRSTLALSVIAMLRLTFQMMEKKAEVEPIPSRAGYEAVPRNFRIVREPPPPEIELSGEGNLMPTSMDEVEARKKERSDWYEKNYIPIETDHKIRTMTADQLVSKCTKNLWRMFIDGEAISANAFFLASRLAVFPGHCWNKRKNQTVSAKVRFVKDNDQFTTYVERVIVDCIADDQVVLQLVSGPAMANLLRNLGDGEFSGFCKMVRRQAGTYEAHVDELYVSPGKISSSSGVLPDRGLLYTLRPPALPTRSGECMSPIISCDGFPRVVGFHCGGDKMGNAAASCARRSIMEKALLSRDLKAQSSDMEFPMIFDDYVLDPAPYGVVQMELDDAPDLRHAVFYYDDLSANGVTLRGYSTQMRSKGFSDLRETPMKELLQYEGYDTIHCLPKPRADRDHAALLEKKMDCMRDINPDLLKLAITDYVEPLLVELDRLKYGHRNPLTIDECLNGIEGSKFINEIKEETSCGFGLRGKKDALVDIHFRAGDGKKIYTPKEKFITEFEKLDELARSGKRINSVAVTALKIEPREKGPDGTPAKPTRIIFVFPFATGSLQKKYFGPIAEFLMSVPMLSETAAGINHTTDEWGQLHGWLTSFGDDRIIAGDYGGWDVRLSAQIIRASAVILCRIGAHLGYGMEDITAMRVLIDEIASTLVSYNGAICSIEGWMISGAWVTLIVNGIGNSLVHRCAWFAPAMEGTFTMKQPPPKFRSAVRLMTMGDDSIGASKTDEFSMVSMSRFCSSINIKYTDANKKPIGMPFSHISEVNFCKRQFRKDFELGRVLSPLAIDSIMRPLNFWTPNNQTFEAYIVPCVVSQLRELARHDKDTFDKYHNIILKASQRLNVDVFIPELKWSHSQWLGDLRARYFTEDLLDFEQPFKINLV